MVSRSADTSGALVPAVGNQFGRCLIHTYVVDADLRCPVGALVPAVSSQFGQPVVSNQPGRGVVSNWHLCYSIGAAVSNQCSGARGV